MRILKARRLRMDPSPQGFQPLCRFNLEPTDGVVIFDCSLVRAPNGRVHVYGPASRTKDQLLSMAPDVRRLVISMALSAAGIDEHEFVNAA